MKVIRKSAYHCHVTNDICRVDYLLVSKESRNVGVGRAIIYKFVEYCHLKFRRWKNVLFVCDGN